MASTVRVFDPAGHVRVVEVEAAPRPASLDGLRPGILENRKPNARVIIRAGSDVEGRWVYGRLNDAPGDRRIRGEIVIGYPPRVVIFLLPEATP